MPEPFNACHYLVDRHVEAGHGDRIAICTSAETVSYAELTRCVCDAAAGLVDMGVRPEERVLLVMADGPELVAAFLGAMRIGAVPVPLNTMLTGRELAGLAADSRARVAVVSSNLATAGALMVANAPELDHVVLVGQAEVVLPRRVARHAWAEEMTGRGGEVAPYLTWDESPGFWLYTSGTTGRPKASMHRHVTPRAAAETYGSAVLGVGAGDRHHAIAKLFFSYGVDAMWYSLAAGASMVLDPDRPTPAGVAAIVSRFHPTLLYAVPTFYAALLAADLHGGAFHSLRLGVSAGEPLPPGLYRRFRDRFGVELLDGLGTTEAQNIFLSNRPGAARPGTAGIPVPGYEARLVDDEGRVVGADTPGDLQVKGETVAAGYWCRTAATRRAFEGEWLHTGDVCTRSGDGFYTYLGRSDDMLKPGGIWVSPAEVEAVLMEDSAVLEAALVGVPDPDGIVRVVACVAAAPGHQVDPAEVEARCAERLAPFKRPRRVVVVDELPKTASGKIQRFKLRQMLAASLPTEAAGDRLGRHRATTVA